MNLQNMHPSYLNSYTYASFPSTILSIFLFFFLFEKKKNMRDSSNASLSYLDLCAGSGYRSPKNPICRDLPTQYILNDSKIIKKLKGKLKNFFTGRHQIFFAHPRIDRSSSTAFTFSAHPVFRVTWES